jgi:adenine-specific DNA-methyltransferase
VAKIDITRTELVWPGKYDEQGNPIAPPRVNLPFQIIETIKESRATREAHKRPAQTSLFDFWGGDEGQTFEDGWRNKLIWGDNLLIMSSLLERFAGKIDLIYIDPPFATGADFNVTTTIGEADLDVSKEQSLIEEKAYRDTWGRGLDSYLSMMEQRLELTRDLLNATGSIYVHTDHRVVAQMRAILDEVFGSEQFRNMITWRRQIPRGMKVYAKFMPFSADYLLLYSKSDEATWNPVTKERLISLDEAASKYMRDERGFFRTSDPGTYSNESLIRLHNEGRIYVSKGGEVKIEDGRLSVTRGTIGVKYYREIRGSQVVEETVADNIWDDVPGMGVMASEYVGYPTQKPTGLLRRVLEASSKPGQLVADFFAGSGTTAVVAEELGRRWIAADLGRFAVHTTRKRLMGIEGCHPFEVMNLGKYERQYWQTASFHGRDPEQVLFEYLAFILKLYGAAPVAGMQYIHGKKGGALVHVGAVDAPVTIDEVMKALDECVATGQKELHVLGWEWEMGLNDTVDQLAVERGVRMKLLAIPREVMEVQAVDRGDIRFFELAHLECSIDVRPKRQAAVSLSGFAMSEADGIDPEVLAKIEKWSDFVDYWAIDWDFKNDTFVNGWVAYRTRKERRLALGSDAHSYEAPGTYRIAVKVVDIFGNDTTKVFTVEVR